jgi:hypothetical protein
MKLDENFRVESDSVGTMLIFEQERKRERDGKEVDFIFTDRWYFLNMTQALNKYVDLKMGKAEDVKELLKLIKELKEQLKK